MTIGRREFIAGSLAASSGVLLTGLSARASAATGAPSRPRIVATSEGRLRGYETGALAVFKGVHYGEDTAAARFQPAVPVKPWSGVRDATRLGHPCFQDNIDPPAWQDPEPESEDCLVLNIWAPKAATKVPVMVWIHGGGFWWGSGGVPAYDGSALAERGDVMVVTLNHRLNAFGYLYLADVAPEFAHCANLGQRDIVEALRWVRRNIAAFGGDPDQVTIFGESGGGAKVSSLLAMPEAKGLFRRAVVQSGSLLHFRSREEGTREAHEVMKAAGVDPSDPKRLATVAPQVLRKAYLEVYNRNATMGALGAMPFSPVLDGSILPFQPQSREALDLSLDVPLLVGTTREEAIWPLSLAGAIPDPASDADMIAILARTFGDIGEPRFKALIAAFREASPQAGRQQLLVDVGSTIWMIAAAVKQADVRTAASAAPVHFYRFDWREPAMGGLWALHGGEVGFVFGTQDLPTIVQAGHNVLAERVQVYHDREWYRVRDAMMESWLAFVKTGDPNNGFVPEWPTYSLEKRAFMRFDASSTTGFGPLTDKVIALLNG